MSHADHSNRLTVQALGQHQQRENTMPVAQKVSFWSYMMSNSNKQLVPPDQQFLGSRVLADGSSLANQGSLRSVGTRSTIRQASWNQPDIPNTHAITRTDTFILPETQAEEQQLLATQVQVQVQVPAQEPQDTPDFRALLMNLESEAYANRINESINAIQRLLEEEGILEVNNLTIGPAEILFSAQQFIK
jgi:adenine-specific DNA methylase